MYFKANFPSGYNIKDVFDDNLDIHIILDNNKVFFGTLFTLKNVKEIMLKEESMYFWATDMVLVKDLEKETVKEVINKIVSEGYVELMFTEIGTIQAVYPNSQTFNELESGF